ncbi:MAG TPA: FKBP-type peptidyl-prolyl cis-trans isomerase [Allosphingosinicella sp.]|nr:FKBP-type peptidyl-prolyl cis-trans isomerase [Allosphingosinicella sp.]
MSVTAVPLQPLKKGSVAKLWIALAVLVALAAAFAWWGTSVFQPAKTATGVVIRTIVAGSGPKITDQDVIALQYKLHANSVDAPVLEDSRTSERGVFATTTEGVYPGFGEGLKHMRPGGAYILTLPPGTHAPEPLPPNAPFTGKDSLVFEIEILQVGVGEGPRFMEMQRMQQMQQMQMQMQGGAPGGAPPEGAPPAGAR